MWSPPNEHRGTAPESGGPGTTAPIYRERHGLTGRWLDTLTSVPRPVFVLVALLLVAAALGTVVTMTALITALGIINVAVVLFLLVRRDLTWAFLGYLTAIIFFQASFWFRLPGFPDVEPGRVTALIVILIFFSQIVLGLRAAPRATRVEKAMLIFIIVLAISVATSGNKPTWLTILRGYAFPFIFFYFARAVVVRESQIRLVMWYLVFLGLYLGIMGIFERLGWYEFVFPKFIVDPTRGHGLARLGFRVRGIFLQPAVLGAVLSMGFFCSWLHLGLLRGVVPRILQVALLVVTVPTIMFTQTRSVFLGFAAALVVAASFSRRLRGVSLVILVGALAVALLNWNVVTSDDRSRGGMAVVNTIHARIAVAYEAMEVFMENPFVGCGFSNFQEAAVRHRRPRQVPLFGNVDIGVGGRAAMHNMLLTILAEQGLLGAVPYFLVFWFILRISLRAYRELPTTGLVSRDFVVCVWCAMAAFFVNAMLLEMRFFEYPNVLYLFLMGSLVGMYERHRRGEVVR